MESIPSSSNSTSNVMRDLLGKGNEGARKSQTVSLVKDQKTGDRFTTKSGTQENIFSSQGISLRAIGQAIIACVYWRPSENKATYDALKTAIVNQYPMLDKDQDFNKHFYFSQKLGFTLTKGTLMKFVDQQIKKGGQELQQQIMKSGQDSRVAGQPLKSAASETVPAA